MIREIVLMAMMTSLEAEKPGFSASNNVNVGLKSLQFFPEVKFLKEQSELLLILKTIGNNRNLV